MSLYVDREINRAQTKLLQFIYMENNLFQYSIHYAMLSIYFIAWITIISALLEPAIYCTCVVLYHMRRIFHLFFIFIYERYFV